MTKGDIEYRVVAMPEPMRQAMQQARDARGQTNGTFVAGAVADHLPRLMEGLQALGHDKLRGQRRPARLPFSQAAGTLQVLREAGDKIQVSAVQLLLLCLAAATAEQPAKPKRRRSRQKASPTDAKSSTEASLNI
jgi:hypothetical protein